MLMNPHSDAHAQPMVKFWYRSKSSTPTSGIMASNSSGAWLAQAA